MAVSPVRAPHFGVIGTGSMAAAMMNTFEQAHVRVRAVASHDPSRSRLFARAFEIPVGGLEIGSLLLDRDIDAVYIANSPRNHAATAIAALEAGKAVLCEKPISISGREAQRVADAARQNGKLCMEGLWTLFLPAYVRFLELARTRAYGDPNHLYADFGYPVSQELLPQLFTPEGGGVLLDRAVYLIALALKLFGPIETIDARIDFTDFGVDRVASLQLGHNGGKQSQLAVSFTSLMSNAADLACTGGLIRLEAPLIGSEAVSARRFPIERASSIDAVVPRSARDKLLSKLRQNPHLRRIKRTLPDLVRHHLSYGSDQYLPQLQHFLALLSSGTQESDVVPMELSLAIQRVIDQIRANHRH